MSPLGIPAGFYCPLPGIIVPIKREVKEEPEETKHIPFLIAADGSDFYDIDPPVVAEPTGPQGEESGSSENPIDLEDDDDLLVAGHEIDGSPAPPVSSPKPIFTYAMPIRSVPLPGLSLPGLSFQSQAAVQQADSVSKTMQPDTYVPLDYPISEARSVLHDARPDTRAFQSDGSPAPTKCFEFALLWSPLSHHLVCGHTTTTASVVGCGETCAVSDHASWVALGKAVPCNVHGCPNYAAPATESTMLGIEDMFGSLNHPTPSSLPAIPDIFRSAGKEIDYTRRAMDGEGGFEAPTTCFSQLRDAPLAHTLVCGHRHETKVPRPCHANCELRRFQDRKPVEKSSFPCEVDDCGKMRRHERLALRSFKNHRITKSASATKRPAMSMRVQRAVFDLAINGTRKLGFENARARRPEALYGVAPLLLPSDVANSQELINADRVTPDNHNSHSLGAEGYRSDGFWSMPADQYARMIEAEDGVIIEPNSPASYAFSDHEDDEDATTDFDMPDTYCVCDAPADGYMVECIRCDKSFHPACVGKGFADLQHLTDEQRHAARELDAQHHLDTGVFTCQVCDDKSKLAQEMLRGKPTRDSLNADIMRRVHEQNAAEREADTTERNRAMFGEGDEAPAGQTRTVRVSTRQTEKRKGIDVMIAMPGIDSRLAAQAAIKPLGTWVISKSDTDAEIVNHLRQMKCAKSGTISCGYCGKKKQGVYFHCLKCKLWDCCDDCAKSGASHALPSHRFAARHTRETHPMTTPEAAADDVGKDGETERKYKPSSGRGTIRYQRSRIAMPSVLGRSRIAKKTVKSAKPEVTKEKAGASKRKQTPDTLFVGHDEDMEL
ncbi:hypothetical protein LTR53_006836 [Teratosphaeriaceae sp. CCFEE 6253]|nr:hypothetical protein LTR53_006836 [Teratosphaeriaceae sp. CCFEE 6253]